MNFVDVAKKLAELLNGRTIYFDHKSYDFAKDIPHIFANGERYNVDRVSFNSNGTFLKMYLDGNKMAVYDFEEEGISTETIQKECEDFGFDALFHDIYYETEESYEIGDFELDFLKI